MPIPVILQGLSIVNSLFTIVGTLFGERERIYKKEWDKAVDDLEWAAGYKLDRLRQIQSMLKHYDHKYRHAFWPSDVSKYAEKFFDTYVDFQAEFMKQLEYIKAVLEHRLKVEEWKTKVVPPTPVALLQVRGEPEIFAIVE